MVLVTGGSLLQGSDDFYPEEQPIREVAVGDLWMDIHTVTNAEFRRFVKDTGHITIAEQAPDPRRLPRCRSAGPRSGVTGVHANRGPSPARRLAAVVALAAWG